MNCLNCLNCQKEFEPATINGVMIAGTCSDECLEKYLGAVHSSSAKPRQTLEDKWKGKCPAKYASFDENKLPLPGRAFAPEVMAWNQSGGRGLGIIGKTNIGKSMMIHHLAKLAFMEGADVHITSATQFALAVGQQDQTKRLTELTRCCDCDVLVFDDIGKEKMTDRVESDMYHVLETRERIDRNCILFTVNSTGSALKAQMSEDRGGPIITRLRRMADILPRTVVKANNQAHSQKGRERGLDNTQD